MEKVTNQKEKQTNKQVYQMSNSIRFILVISLITTFVYFGLEKYQVISYVLFILSLVVTFIRFLPFFIKSIGDIILVIFEPKEIKMLKYTLIRAIEFTICFYLVNFMMQLIYNHLKALYPLLI